jgi:hypothetical protein
MNSNNIIKNINNSSSQSILTRLIPVFIVFAGLIGLYFLYQYLFGPKQNNAYPLITSIQSARTPADKPLIFSTGQLAPLYEGGEFTVSTWIYITDWHHRANKNKSILRIGGKTDQSSSAATNFDTIRIYLGAVTPTLHVRLDSKNRDVSSTDTGDSLDTSTYTMTYNNVQTGSGLLDSTHKCDIREIPMQRWVNIAVAVNGKTVDVYIDGKLSRSCVLPNPFKVDSSGYTGVALEKEGFGGEIATMTMYDTALNPEVIYKNYMAGPEPITSIGGLLGSFFAPNIKIAVTNA